MIKPLSCIVVLFVVSCGFFISFNGFCVVQASTNINEIPEPYVPEFTLKYVDYFYDVPPVYGIDEFTGKR